MSSATSRPSSRSARSRRARAKRSRSAAPTRASRRSTSRSRTWRRCCCGSTTAPRAASRSGRSAPGTRTICSSKSAVRARRCDGTRRTRTSCWIGRRDKANELLAEGSVAARHRGGALRAPAGRPPGGVGGRVLQRDARHLRLHRRGQEAVRCRIRLRLRRSKTATARTASSRRSSRARANGSAWTKVTVAQA